MSEDLSSFVAYRCPEIPEEVKNWLVAGIAKLEEYRDSLILDNRDLQKEIDELKDYAIEQVGIEYVPEKWGGELK